MPPILLPLKCIPESGRYRLPPGLTLAGFRTEGLALPYPCDKLVAASFPARIRTMSAFPDSEISVPAIRTTGLSPVRYAALSTVLGVLGLSTIWFTMATLWGMWTADPLKSIGMVMPVVSLILILRVWRRLGWRGGWNLVGAGDFDRDHGDGAAAGARNPNPGDIAPMVNCAAAALADALRLRLGRSSAAGRSATVSGGAVSHPASVFGQPDPE